MAEKCDACNGRLEEDFMSDYLTMSVDQRPCSKCQGTGVIERTGPYRLVDGTWSDGVDRKHEIAAYRFGIANPSRMSVNFDEPEGVFAVWKGRQPIKEFLTHAEAIAYADRMARGA